MSTLSLYLFALVMNNFTWSILDKVYWGILFASDAILVNETKHCTVQKDL